MKAKLDIGRVDTFETNLDKYQIDQCLPSPFIGQK